MTLEDLLGLGKTSRKLIDTFEKGVGAIWNDIFKMDVKRIKRIENAKNEAEKNKIIEQAVGEATADAIKAQTKNHINNVIQKKQILRETERIQNLVKTVILTAQELVNYADLVSTEPVNKDWAIRFFNIVQDIDDKQLRVIWSRILADEIKKPESFSIRTLETLKNISKNEAEYFQKAVSLSFENQYIIETDPNNGNEFYDYGLSYYGIMMLNDAGLLLPNKSTFTALPKEKNKRNLESKSEKISITRDKFEEDLVYGAINFTIAGKETSRIIDVKSNEGYIHIVKKFLRDKGYKVE